MPKKADGPIIMISYVSQLQSEWIWCTFSEWRSHILHPRPVDEIPGLSQMEW